MAWFRRFADWEQDTTDPVEFLESLKLDLDQGEVPPAGRRQFNR